MFYCFSQNNSGGIFDYSYVAGISHYVIVEAKSANDANILAEEIGLYFDGVEEQRDCPCCGDRWYTVSDSDGTVVPMIYGTDVSSGAYNPKFPVHGFIQDGVEGFIHFLDGSVVPIAMDVPNRDSKNR